MTTHWFARTCIAISLSALLLYAVLGLGDWSQLWSAISTVSAPAVGLWVCTYGFLIYLRAARFNVLLPKSRRFTLIRAIGVQGGINRIIPFRLGELSLPFLIRQRDILPTTSILVSLAWVRLLELTLICVSIALGMVLHLMNDHTPLVHLLIFGATLGLLLVFVAIDPRRVAQLLAAFLRSHLTRLSALNQRLHQGVSAVITEVDALPHLSILDRFTLLGWSLAVHACILFLYFSMLDVFGASVSIAALLIGVGASQVTSLLPMLTVGTIGLHELGWVSGFVYGGLNTEMAVTSGLLTQAFTLLLGVCWAGGLYLTGRPVISSTS